MRVAAIVALAFAVMLGASACKCMDRGERGERWNGHHKMMTCPMAQPMMDKEGCGEMMEHMGMDQHMRMHCMAMMNTKMLPADPAKLMAMEEHLKLTNEQMDKLAKIQKDAAAQAEEVLTADQKAMVEKMKELPATMMGMCGRMHKMMMKDGMMDMERGGPPMNEGPGEEPK